LLIAACWACSAAADGDGGLSDYQRISSTQLGYDLQYRIYLPAGIAADRLLPSLYVTDGQWYLASGELAQLIDEMIGDGRIEPLVAVFVDSRNPEDLNENRRNSEFMCNAKYAAFFANELLPAINAVHPVSSLRQDRVILGMSFGGLNAACFGIMLPEFFGGIAMQSPASGEHLDAVRELYVQSPRLPLKMFLSVGTENDNLKAATRFRRTLEKKGYDLNYRKVRRGHDWQNWKPLLDDVLLYYFAKEDSGG
jgi:enterochelin esterase-like enzyme